MRRGSQFVFSLLALGGVALEVGHELPAYRFELHYNRALLSRWLNAVPRAAITLHTNMAFLDTFLGRLGMAERKHLSPPDPAPAREVAAARPDNAPVEAAKKTAGEVPAQDQAPAKSADQDAPVEQTQSEEVKAAATLPDIEISRLGIGAPSVFAGRAAPGSAVTLFEDATPFASAVANDDGEWSLATEHQFGSPDAQISVRAGALMPPPPAPDPPRAPEAGDTPKPTVAQGLLKDFEDAVAVARSEQEEAGRASPVAPSPPEIKPATAEESSTAQITAERDEAQTVPREAPPPATVIPLPMQFHYNEARLTEDGEHAVSLLLEYLKLKDSHKVRLTGHADERGSPEFNLKLSEERLATIERELRRGGYQGEIDLVAKGESEPFRGVDRTRMSADEVMQLDRRVELRIAE